MPEKIGHLFCVVHGGDGKTFLIRLLFIRQIEQSAVSKLDKDIALMINAGMAGRLDSARLMR